MQPAGRGAGPAGALRNGLASIGADAGRRHCHVLLSRLERVRANGRSRIRTSYSRRFVASLTSGGSARCGQPERVPIGHLLSNAWAGASAMTTAREWRNKRAATGPGLASTESSGSSGRRGLHRVGGAAWSFAVGLFAASTILCAASTASASSVGSPRLTTGGCGCAASAAAAHGIPASPGQEPPGNGNGNAYVRTGAKALAFSRVSRRASPAERPGQQPGGGATGAGLSRRRRSPGERGGFARGRAWAPGQ